MIEWLKGRRIMLPQCQQTIAFFAFFGHSFSHGTQQFGLVKRVQSGSGQRK